MKHDVLILCQYFYPEYISSATLPTDVAKVLKKTGINVDVMTGYPVEYSEEKKVPKKEVVEGISIRRIKYITLKRSNILGRLINFFSFFTSMSLRLLKLKKYKVIIVYSNPPILPLLAVWAKKLFKTKIVFVSFDVYPEVAINTNVLGEGSLISKVMKYINNKLYKNVDKVVALSNDMKEFLLLNREIKENQIEVIPNWYNESELQETNHVVEEIDDFVGDADLVVSYFGNMGVCQDMETIMTTVDSLKSHDNIKFLFAGHGVKVDAIKSYASDNQLKNIKIFEFLKGDDYNYALQKSDCFIISLEKKVEGLAVPSKTYSYMMAGKTLISIMSKKTDIAKEIKEKKLGVQVNNGESEELNNALLKLSDNKTFLKESGQRTRALFLKKYTMEVCTQQYVEILEELLK